VHVAGGPTRDEWGRLWVNGPRDRAAEQKVRDEMQGEGVSAVDPPRPIRLPITLDGSPVYGQVHARRHTARGWEGLVLVEREYTPGWWHLQARWVSAGSIEVLDAPPPSSQDA
jgi:hypothetical protein